MWLGYSVDSHRSWPGITPCQREHAAQAAMIVHITLNYNGSKYAHAHPPLRSLLLSPQSCSPVNPFHPCTHAICHTSKRIPTRAASPTQNTPPPSSPAHVPAYPSTSHEPQPIHPMPTPCWVHSPHLPVCEDPTKICHAPPNSSVGLVITPHSCCEPPLNPSNC